MTLNNAGSNQAGRRPAHAPSISPKIQPWHLDRLAIVYIRQSTPHQVAENRESTIRQYALVNRAIELRWPRERISSSTRIKAGAGPRLRAGRIQRPRASTCRLNPLREIRSTMLRVTLRRRRS